MLHARYRQCNVLFIIADSKLKVARHDTLLLVIASGITSKFEDFSSKVFKNGSEVDCVTTSD